MITAMHLTASTFFGGPERQMLGLARAMDPEVRSVFLSFLEGGRCHSFVDLASSRGLAASALEHDTPHFLAGVREISRHLTEERADILLCHGYKAGLLGRIAARRIGIPVVAVSRGWTGECRRVRLYELLDRLNLRWMDRTICVSDGQAEKALRAGVPRQRLSVIRNSIDTTRFDEIDPMGRIDLAGLFPSPLRLIVGAAGRLSLEKGFDLLVRAATTICGTSSDVGFVLFGEGILRGTLARQIREAGLESRFIIGGFREDLDRLMPHLDLLVQASHTEGMPNVLLEACAAGVPVVATSVGGTQEILADGAGGLLVPPGNWDYLAKAIGRLLGDASLRRDLGQSGKRRMKMHFSFEAQAQAYSDCFEELLSSRTSNSRRDQLEGLSTWERSRAIARSPRP